MSSSTWRITSLNRRRFFVENHFIKYGQFMNCPYTINSDKLFLPQNVNEIIAERNALSDQIKQLTQMKSEKENQIKVMMKESETARTGKYMITWKSVVSKRFDTKKFKSDHMDLYKAYTKETSARRLTIKEA